MDLLTPMDLFSLISQERSLCMLLTLSLSSIDKADHIISGCNQMEMINHENVSIYFDSLILLTVF